MSNNLLSKIKKIQEDKGAKAPNPFVKKAETAATKPEQVIITEPPLKVETPVKANPFAKTNPFAKKVEETPMPEEVKETPVVEKKTPVPDVVEPEIEMPKEEVETTDDVSTTEVKQDSKPKEEVKKKNNRGKNKTAKKTNDKTENIDEPDTEKKTVAVMPVAQLEIPRTEMDYIDAIKSIQSPFIDEDWLVFRQKIEDKLTNVTIDSDMNSATLTDALSKLDEVRQEIWIQYNDVKTLYEQLVSEKPEGLIERIKKLNAVGMNDSERKLAAVSAVMHHKDPNGNKINLYEVLDETRIRYNFLNTCMDTINFKSRALITVNGALKLESSL